VFQKFETQNVRIPKKIVKLIISKF